MAILSLSEAKRVCKVDGEDDDLTIQGMIDAAQIWIERVTGKTFDPAPEDVKQVARMLVAHWYDHRSAVTDGQQYPTPMGVRALLANHRSFAHGAPQ